MSEENTNWAYKPDGGDGSSHGRSVLSWEASEYIDHPHGPGWYALLTVGTALLTVTVYLLSSRDAFAAGVIIALGIIVGIYAGYKPKVVRYEINSDGLKVNEKTFRYRDYKSFGVVKDGSLFSLNLFPLKRLKPPIAAFFDPADEKKIVEALGNYLPYEERKLDTVERLARRLRL